MEPRRKKHPGPRLSSPAARPAKRGLSHASDRDILATIPDRASFLQDESGRPTHAVIPHSDYMYLVALQAAREAEQSGVLDDPKAEWIDLEDLVARWNTEKLVNVRRSRNLTQAQLGKLVGMPQSQISRLEKNPDASSLRLIKKIAKALKIPPRELV